MVRAIHDVKGIDMGNYLVRYKAELDFDGRELTRSYLDKQDLNELLEVLRYLGFLNSIFFHFVLTGSETSSEY
jgi:zinc transporter 9